MTLLGEETQLLTVGEVALRLRQSERTVRDKVAAGLIPAVRIGDGPRAPIRIRADDLDHWLYAPPAAVTTTGVGNSSPRRGPEEHEA